MDELDSEPTDLHTHHIWPGGVAQLVQCLLSIHKNLDLIPGTSQHWGGRGRRIRRIQSFHQLRDFEASLGYMGLLLTELHTNIGTLRPAWATWDSY